MIELTLPYPPSVNHYKVIGRLSHTKNGRLYQARVSSDETKRYFYEVWHRFQQMKVTQGVKSFDDVTIMLQMTVDLYPPDKRRRDIDNPLKVICDSLQAAHVFVDDYQIARLLVERREIIRNGQITVRIAPL